MISINKEEAKAMREYLPNAHIVRTMKQKSKQVIKFLKNMRNGGLAEKKVGVSDGHIKKAR